MAAIGLAGGNKLDTTVIPFLLRGVNLLGIDSVMCPGNKRAVAWQRIASDLDLAALDTITTVKPLADLPALGGKHTQRWCAGTYRDRCQCLNSQLL